MGRAPCCSKVGLHRGPWTPREDALLANYIQCQGEGNWRNLPKNAGLLRCGKSCRLRWVNYLRPDIKRGNIGAQEEDLIIRLHGLLGNRWSLIAGRLPGRTDNEIKNYWNSHLSKRQKRQGMDLREGSSKAASDENRPTQRKGSRHNNKNPDHKRKKAKVEGTEETTTRIKIHAPKPTRIRPIFRNSNAMEVSEGTDSKNGTTTSEEEVEEEKVHASVGNLDIDWFKEADPQAAGGDINHVSCDLPSQYNLFEMLYQEYLQLLNSDSDQLQVNPFADRWYGYESL